MSSKLITTRDKKVVLVANVKDVPFKCVVCRKVFISDGYLGRHYTRRHPSPNLPLHSWKTKVKADNVDCESDQHSIKAVLNATERIECLLANLTLGRGDINGLPQNKVKSEVLFQEKQPDVNETFPVTASNNANKTSPEPTKSVSNESIAHTENYSNATFDLPLANSTQIEINSDSLEDIASYLQSRSFSDDDSSGGIAQTSCKNITSRKSYLGQNNGDTPDCSKKPISGESQSTSSSSNKGETPKEDGLLNKSFSCLATEENVAIQRIISYTPKPLPRKAGVNYTSNTNQSLALSETVVKDNSSDVGSHGEQETPTEAYHRLKNEALLMFNGKLRNYGIDPDWKNIPDKTVENIKGLLKAERERMIKNYPDYNNLRELINHNANTRIEMSLRR